MELNLKILEAANNVKRISQTNFQDNCENHASKILKMKIKTLFGRLIRASFLHEGREGWFVY